MKLTDKTVATALFIGAIAAAGFSLMGGGLAVGASRAPDSSRSHRPGGRQNPGARR